MDRYKNKYRIPSARAQWWDYRWDASYFVTICTHDRRHYFGRIQNDLVELSDLGKIANDAWHDIVNHASNVQLGPYVVMPNHIHGIVNLKGNATAFVETRPALSLPVQVQMDENEHPKSIGQMRYRNPGKNSISTIIGGYKSSVTREAHKSHFYFGWQARFHDHIIRDEEEYYRISDYIRNNPANWQQDKFYLDCL